MSDKSRKIDCIINTCGKAHQTALTLLSLMRHSGEHIDKIFFINDKKTMGNHEFIIDKFSEKIEYYEPKHWHWMYPVDEKRFDDDKYRLSIRYQYGWENSEKDFVFITHNDCVYHADIIGAFLENIGNHVAIGQIGQCWNCPASWAKKCVDKNYWDYRPSFDALSWLYNSVEPPPLRASRPYPLLHSMFKKNPWPLPECRVNEWSCLINLSIAKELTLPKGPARAFGLFGLATDEGEVHFDTGAWWFRDISHMDYRCKNFPVYDYMSHKGLGDAALFDKEQYVKNEDEALKRLRQDFAEELEIIG